MAHCPNCGSQNNDGDRFCSSCGAQLGQDLNPPTSEPAMTPEQPQTPTGPSAPGAAIPPPVDFAPAPGVSVDEEWRMSSLGPPPKRKRSIWLWILIGLIAVCILACVGLIGFSLTDTGQRWISDIATEAASQATEAADN